MNSNPTTLSVDEQIDEIFANHKIGYVCDTDEEATSRFKSIKSDLQSLIRQVCEEVIAKPSLRCGSVLEIKSEDYILGDINGYNECYKDSMTKLNKIMGEK